LSFDFDGNTPRKVYYSHRDADREFEFDYLISSIPLKYTAEYLDPAGHRGIGGLSQELKYRDIRVIYVILDKDYHSDIHWFYLLDPHFKFNRMSEQKNLNKESSPEGKTVISLDISCSCGDDVWNMGEEEFFELAVRDLSYLGIRREHITDHFSLKLKDVYPVYSIGFDSTLRRLISNLSDYKNVYSTGRQGLFLNNDIHDSLEMGILAARSALEGKESAQWYSEIDKYIVHKLEGTVK
jgi:protoporphyrinogen oxidase